MTDLHRAGRTISRLLDPMGFDGSLRVLAQRCAWAFPGGGGGAENLSRKSI